jgi:uncharacterized protein (DUF697 family)
MTADEKADGVINTMVVTVVGTAVIPAYVNWAATAAAMGSGVVMIGVCYNITLSREEAWHLVKQFIGAAGFWFLGMAVGSKILSMILTSTGVGYFGAVAMDAAVSGAIAYAIGASAKAYFKGTRSSKELGEIFRKNFKSSKAKIEEDRKRQQP